MRRPPPLVLATAGLLLLGVILAVTWSVVPSVSRDRLIVAGVAVAGLAAVGVLLLRRNRQAAGIGLLLGASFLVAGLAQLRREPAYAVAPIAYGGTLAALVLRSSTLHAWLRPTDHVAEAESAD